MLSRQIRHWAVALGLVITGAAGAVGSLHRSGPAESRPEVAGDLGEIVVVAPHDLGEVVVRAPRDLQDIIVMVRPLPPSGSYLARVVVTAAPLATGAVLASTR